jgi:hypothetical protein
MPVAVHPELHLRGDAVSSRLHLAAPLLAAGGFIRNAIRALVSPPSGEPVDVVQARIGLALANTDHPGRRTALILARHSHPEQP